MEAFFLKIWSGIKQDVKPIHSDFKYTLMWCAGITASTFFSLFCTWAIWLTLVLCVGAVLTSKGGRVVYILIFIAPLCYIFKSTPTSPTLRVFIILLVAIVLGIKYCTRLFQKKAKIEVLPTIFLVLLIVLFCIPFTFHEIEKTGLLITWVVLIYVFWNFRRDIDMREVFLLLFCAIAISAVFGLFALGGGIRASEFIILVPYRFAGIYYSPLILCLDAMFCMAILFVLFLNNSMKYIFYPIFAILTACIISTGSKSSLIVFMFSLTIFLILLILKWKSNKVSYKKILAFIFSMMCICLVLTLIFNEVLSIAINRFSNIVDQNGTWGEIGPKEIDYNRSSLVNVLDSVTTYRFSLWLEYLKEIFSSIGHAFFGFGVDGQYFDKGFSPHSTYIAILFHFGIFGAIIMLAWLLVLFIPLLKGKKINWWNIVGLISLAFFLVSYELLLNLPLYFILSLPLLTYRENVCDNNSPKENLIEK